jgi:hypothetical protein
VWSVELLEMVGRLQVLNRIHTLYSVMRLIHDDDSILHLIISGKTQISFLKSNLTVGCVYIHAICWYLCVLCFMIPTGPLSLSLWLIPQMLSRPICRIEISEYLMKKWMFEPGRAAVIFYLIKFELQILDPTWDPAFDYSRWNVFQMV